MNGTRSVSQQPKCCPLKKAKKSNETKIVDRRLFTDVACDILSKFTFARYA